MCKSDVFWCNAYRVVRKMILRAACPKTVHFLLADAKDSLWGSRYGFVDRTSFLPLLIKRVYWNQTAASLFTESKHRNTWTLRFWRISKNCLRNCWIPAMFGLLQSTGCFCSATDRTSWCTLCHQSVKCIQAAGGGRCSAHRDSEGKRDSNNKCTSSRSIVQCQNKDIYQSITLSIRGQLITV